MALYLCGMALVLVGLGCIASADVGTSVAPETGAEEGGQGAGRRRRPMFAPAGRVHRSLLDGGSGEEASGADPTPGATPTAGAPRAASSGTLNKAKELAVVVKDLVDWSEQEQRLSRVLHESPGASRMPTPTAIVYSASRLIALRHRIESARQSLAASPFEVEEGVTAGFQAVRPLCRGRRRLGGVGMPVGEQLAGGWPHAAEGDTILREGSRRAGPGQEEGPATKQGALWPVDRPTNQRWPTARSGGSNNAFYSTSAILNS